MRNFFQALGLLSVMVCCFQELTVWTISGFVIASGLLIDVVREVLYKEV